MRHLIDPADFTLEETLSLMDLADRIHENPAAYRDVAARKRLATLFYEPSTRTRAARCLASPMPVFPAPARERPWLIPSAWSAA